MEKNLISENLVKTLLDDVLLEETSKVSRHEFSRTQFKIEELQNALIETIKELRKLEDSIPSGLKTLMSSRMGNISQNLHSAQKNLSEIKEKVKTHKKKIYTSHVEEKKN